MSRPAARSAEMTAGPGMPKGGMQADKRRPPAQASSMLLGMPAVIPDYESLRTALNERRIALKMTMVSLGADAKLQDGYAAKMICGDRNFGPTTLWPVIDALGLQMVLVPSALTAPFIASAPARQIANIRRKRPAIPAPKPCRKTNRWSASLRKFSRHVDAFLLANPPPSAP